MRPFAERRAARIERLTRAAGRARAGSKSAFGAARRLGDAIPFGQPILVGHHSERRARRDAERIHANMNKAVTLGKQAEELARRAEAAEENRAVSSDDPEAVTLLWEKLAKEEAHRDRWKAINKAARKEGDGALAALGLTAGEARILELSGRKWTGYMVTNASGNIRRVKQRIVELEAQAARPAAQPETFGAVTVDEDQNRTRIHFPGKPAASVIADLKSNGFRWCRSDSCWQRMASPQAWEMARSIARGLAP